jgi:hypothetical protein
MRREMHYRLYAYQCRFQKATVCNVGNDQFEVFSEKAMSGGKIVVDKNVEPLTAERARCVTSDVAGASKPRAQFLQGARQRSYRS